MGRGLFKTQGSVMALASGPRSRAEILVLVVAVAMGCRSAAPVKLPPATAAAPAPRATSTAAASSTSTTVTPLPTAGNQPADAGRSGAVRAGDAPGGQGSTAPVIMSGDSLPAGVRQANFPQPVSDAASDAVLDDRMFASQSELQVEPLVSQIVARNPSIEAMSSAWQAASQRYPQVVSLDDPVLMSMIAPASFGSNLVSPAYVVGGSQKIPWLGKRAARGRVAQEEANAAMYDVQQTRLVVIEGCGWRFTIITWCGASWSSTPPTGPRCSNFAIQPNHATNPTWSRSRMCCRPTWRWPRCNAGRSSSSG